MSVRCRAPPGPPSDHSQLPRPQRGQAAGGSSRRASARRSRGPLTARRPSRAEHHGACGPGPATRSRRWRSGSVGPPDPPARGCPELVKPELFADIGVRMPHQRGDTDARACSPVRPARLPAADEPPRCAGSDSEPSESQPMPTGRWRVSRFRGAPFAPRTRALPHIRVLHEILQRVGGVSPGNRGSPCAPQRSRLAIVSRFAATSRE